MRKSGRRFVFFLFADYLIHRGVINVRKSNKILNMFLKSCLCKTKAALKLLQHPTRIIIYQKCGTIKSCPTSGISAHFIQWVDLTLADRKLKITAGHALSFLYAYSNKIWINEYKYTGSLKYEHDDVLMWLWKFGQLPQFVSMGYELTKKVLLQIYVTTI